MKAKSVTVDDVTNENVRELKKNIDGGSGDKETHPSGTSREGFNFVIDAFRNHLAACHLPPAPRALRQP